MAEAAVGRAGLRLASPVFVGRTDELAALEAALAWGGRTAAVLVGGEAGAGKTRLVAEFTATAAVSGARVVGGGCVALGAENLPYAPFMDALGELVAQVGAAELEALLGPGRVELARLVPELRRPGDDHRPSGAAERSVLFQVVARTLEAAAASAPLVVVVEDLHWADTSSRELVAFLLGRLRGPVLLVATYRSDEVHRAHPLRPLLAQAARSERVLRLELAPLTPAEVARQVEAIAGGPAPAAAVEAVVARAEGNPFFVEELVAAGGGDELPPDLAEILAARLAALPAVAQEVVRVAAVAGRRVGHELLAAAVAQSLTDVGAGLREAVSHNVLVVDDAGAYAFRHALLAEVAYAELLPAERIGLHRAYAAGLAAHPEWATTAAGAAGELAHHWLAGREPARALEASVAAAEAAVDTYAFAQAHALYEQVLALWDQVAAPRDVTGCDRAQILQRAADAAVLAGAGARAVALARAALEDLDHQVDPARAAMLHERLARLLSESGETEASLAASSTAAALMPSGPSVERAQVLAGEARTLMLAGRYGESAGRAQAAVEVARAAGGRREEGYALNTLGASLGRLGRHEEAVPLLEQALAVARAVGSIEDMRRAYNNLAVTVEEAGDLARAAAVALEGAEHLDALSYDDGARLMRSSAATVLLAAGRWAEADALVSSVLASAPANQAGWQTLLAASTIALRRGEFAAAHAHLDKAQGLWSTSTYADYRAMTALATAELALAEGRLGQARDIVEDGLQMLADTEAFDYLFRLVGIGLQAEADLRQARGRAPAANPRRADELIARVRTKQGMAAGHEVQATPQGRALQLLCEAEWARAGGHQDPQAWADVAAAWGKTYPFEATYARFRQAEALLAVGAKDEAAVVLRAACSDASQLGAGPLVADIETLARRARLRLAPDAAVRPPSPVGEVGLTPREAEVLRLVAAGHTNRQIADALYMSEKTASVHVSRILTKLGVVNRGQAAAIAHRLHLLDEDEEPGG